MTFGNKIKKLRKERNWKQSELAKKVNMHERYISRYELGQVSPTADAIIKFANVFNVSTDYLLYDEDPKRPNEYQDEKLNTLIGEIKKMSIEDKNIITSVIEAFIAKNKK